MINIYRISNNFVKALRKHSPQVTSVVQNINPAKTSAVLSPYYKVLYGSGYIVDELCGLQFSLSSRSFYQVNPTQTEKLYRKALISQEADTDAMDVLLNQQICHKLEGKLDGIVPVAHKTGEDENLSNDVGIVFAPQPFVICFAGHDTEVYPWEDLIRRAAFDLYRAQIE